MAPAAPRMASVPHIETSRHARAFDLPRWSLKCCVLLISALTQWGMLGMAIMKMSTKIATRCSRTRVPHEIYPLLKKHFKKHGLHVVFIWSPYGLHVVFTWFSCGFHVVFSACGGEDHVSALALLDHEVGRTVHVQHGGQKALLHVLHLGLPVEPRHPGGQLLAHHEDHDLKKHPW